MRRVLARQCAAAVLVGMVAAATAVPAATAVAATPAEAADRVVLSWGHADVLDTQYQDGELRFKVLDYLNTVRDPADVILQALPSSATQVPDNPRFAFLGAPGATVWMLPQTPKPDLLWPGWTTTALEEGVFAGDKIRMSLVGVDGPGAVHIFTTGTNGVPSVKFASPDGLPDVLDVPIYTHAHVNWAFSALGTYTLTFQGDATLLDGSPVSTGPVDYTFVVGDLTGPQPDPTTSLSVQGAARPYQPGATVTLTAAQNPPTTDDHYRWFRRCPADSDYASVPGVFGGVHTFTATEQLHGCRYLVKLYNHNLLVVGESAPVTLTVGQAAEDGPSQQITATVDPTHGALAVAVDPEDRVVVLPPAVLAASADRWQTAGLLRPVTVTDTRAAAPGWNVSGQVSDFTSAGGGVSGAFLGWTPAVAGQAPGQGVTPGPAVPSGFVGGNGLSASSILGSAAAGAGRGTAHLTADLYLELPTDIAPGTYAATLTITAI